MESIAGGVGDTHARTRHREHVACITRSSRNAHGSYICVSPTRGKCGHHRKRDPIRVHSTDVYNDAPCGCATWHRYADACRTPTRDVRGRPVEAHRTLSRTEICPRDSNGRAHYSRSRREARNGGIQDREV